MITASALYRGWVRHHRLRPRKHALRYRVFWLLLDLDEIDRLDRNLRLFSRNRFNLLSFFDRDYGDGSGRELRVQTIARLAAAGVDLGGGPIRLLTMPRVLGFVFNPISLFYCHRPDGALGAVVYEVNSTFGERHAYVLSVAGSAAPSEAFVQSADKALYVSPFLDMDMSYAFRGHAPGASLDLAIAGADREGVLITASMGGYRRPLSDRQIAAAAAAVPLLTLKVVAAIHWEALKLWLKGVPLTRRVVSGHPPAPAPAPAASPIEINQEF